MKILCLFTSLLLLNFLPAAAQQKHTWDFLIKGDGLLTNFTGRNATKNTTLNGESGGHDYYPNDQGNKILEPNYAAGIGAQYNINPNLSLQLDGMVSRYGGRVNTVAIPNFYYGNGLASSYLTYLKFPFELQIFPFNARKFFLAAGIYYAHLLHSKGNGNFTGHCIDCVTTDTVYIKYGFAVHSRKNDAGIQLNAGYQLPVFSFHPFWLVADYSRGIIPVSPRMTPNTPQYYNQSFSLGLAYHWKL